MISIIIPVYQEKVDSKEIGKAFCDLGYDVQVVISTDDFHKGKGFAIKEGLKAAECGYVVFMDADMQIPPYELKSFFKVMELYNADVVVGNKRHPYSNITYTLRRKIISNGYRLLCNLLFNLHIKDTQCGFKLFKKEVLDLVIDKIKTDRYAFDLELLIAIKENGFRIVDAPVYVKKQINKGSIAYKNIWETFVDTLKIWVLKNKGWYVA